MAFEYQMLWLMTLLFLFAWVPTSYAKFISFGWKWVASNREPMKDKEMVDWGKRAERAYSNLKDYFPGYIVAILLLGITNHFDVTTAWASGIYVAARILHYFFYVIGNSTLRAIAFIISMSANIYLLIKTLP